MEVVDDDSLPPRSAPPYRVAVGETVRMEFANTLNSRFFFLILGVALGMGLGFCLSNKRHA